MRPFPLAALALLLASACSSSETTTSTSTGSGGATTSSGGGMGGQGGGAPLGGDRPVDLVVPSSYQKGVPTPLVLLLHGYSVNGTVQDLYFQLAPLAEKYGFLYAHPDGTIDKDGKYFWNATDACCDFYGSNVDDSAYLSGLIDEIKSRYTVDPKRVYLIGHSNGGFMSYRMACDHADQITAIASLAGAMFDDVSQCHPKEPVSVLQIHGTDDMEVLYDGAPSGPGQGMGAYPSASQTVLDWATIDGCTLTADTSSPPLDLDTQITGAETTVETYAQNCKPGGGARLWSIQGGVHIPMIGDEFREDVIGFLLAQKKP
jgi:polyhydroxybutyrate depolymerase